MVAKVDRYKIPKPIDRSVKVEEIKWRQIKNKKEKNICFIFNYISLLFSILHAVFIGIFEFRAHVSLSELPASAYFTELGTPLR